MTDASMVSINQIKGMIAVGKFLSCNQKDRPQS